MKLRKRNAGGVEPTKSHKTRRKKFEKYHVPDREGMDTAEEFPDLEGGGGTGMAKDCSSGEELRGNGAAPIQQVQGWDLKKDR